MEENILPNKRTFSNLLSQKLKRKIEVIDIKAIGGGYHSNGFKLTTADNQNYFIKRFKSKDMGFAFPERKVSSLMTSDSMGRRAAKSPLPMGVLLINKDEGAILPEISENTEIYQLQEYMPDATSYYALLTSDKNKKRIDDADLKNVEKITDYIASIHAIKHPSIDQKHLVEIYNDGIRAILNCPELTITLLHDFEKDNPILDLAEQKEFLNLMYDLIHRWKNRSDRLCALHGDFWGANVFFDKDQNIKVIDYSRIPWGDPGIDIGWWMSQYLWLYYGTNNKYFQELGELFLDKYVQKTGDQDIRAAMALVMGLMGIINVYPKFYTNVNPELGRRFIAQIKNILQKGEFYWEEQI